MYFHVNLINVASHVKFYLISLLTRLNVVSRNLIRSCSSAKSILGFSSFSLYCNEKSDTTFGEMDWLGNEGFDAASND